MALVKDSPVIIELPAELTTVREERQTILHCSLPQAPTNGPAWDILIRIWPTTFLIQEDGTRRKLLFTEGIALFPYWLPVRLPYTFTLIFEGLDSGCQIFDLLEEIPQPGGFQVTGIARNGSDVYHVRL
jgi:hypothetical protein